MHKINKVISTQQYHDHVAVKVIHATYSAVQLLSAPIYIVYNIKESNKEKGLISSGKIIRISIVFV